MNQSIYIFPYRYYNRTNFRSTDRATPRTLDRGTPLWVSQDRSTPRSQQLMDRSTPRSAQLDRSTPRCLAADEKPSANIVSFQDTIPRPKLIGRNICNILVEPS